MTKDEILVQIKSAIREILPEISEMEISREKSLADLGANSIDRTEIIMESMMKLGIKASLVEVASIKNIGDLADFYYSKLNAE